MQIHPSGAAKPPHPLAPYPPPLPIPMGLGREGSSGRAGMEGGHGRGLGIPILATLGSSEKAPHTHVPIPALSAARWPPHGPSRPHPRRHPAFGISLLPSGSRCQRRTRGCTPRSRVRALGSRRVTMAVTCGNRRKGPSTGASWPANWPKSGIKTPPRATRGG